MIVAQSVTTPESHPGLHVMRKVPSHVYFTDTAPEQLIADAQEQHAAVWPLVERLLHKYRRENSGVVVDAWHLRPSIVAPLQDVQSLWLVAAPEVLEARENANRDWLQESRDPQRMLRNFLARSLHFNAFVEREAMTVGLPVLRQDGSRSVEALCEEAFSMLTTDQG